MGREEKERKGKFKIGLTRFDTSIEKLRIRLGLVNIMTPIFSLFLFTLTVKPRYLGNPLVTPLPPPWFGYAKIHPGLVI